MLRLLRCFAIFYRALCNQSDLDWADVSKVQIRREAAGPVPFRMITRFRIRAQIVGNKFVESFKRRMCSSRESVNRSDGAVEILPTLRDVIAHIKTYEICRMLLRMNCLDLGLRYEIVG
jgi:hypothetical protein